MRYYLPVPPLLIIKAMKTFFLAEPPQILPIDFEAEAFYEGDLAQANCVLRKGDRPVKFVWKFNGLDIFNSDDTEVVSVGSRTSILTLDPVRAHHQGRYSCTAVNGAGKAEVAVSLIVNGIYLQGHERMGRALC